MMLKLGVTSKPSYIKWIRNKVGHEKVFLNFVAAIIFDSEGKILLQKRSDKNKWGVPGGAIELGETIEQTLKREVFEETGLIARATKLQGVYSKFEVSYPNGDVCQPISIVLYAKVISGKLKIGDDGESLDLKYFSKDKLPELAGPDFEKIIADAFAKRTGVWK